MSLHETLRRLGPDGPTSASDEDSGARKQRAHRSSGIERALWLVVLAAMAADVVLTHVGQQVGLVELNPVARDALHAHGVWGLVALKGLALGCGAGLWAVFPRRYTTLVPLGLALPTIPAVVSNVAVISLAVT